MLQCTGCTAYVYFENPQFIKKIPLASSWKPNLVIGRLDGKLVKYNIFRKPGTSNSYPFD